MQSRWPGSLFCCSLFGLSWELSVEQCDEKDSCLFSERIPGVSGQRGHSSWRRCGVALLIAQLILRNPWTMPIVDRNGGRFQNTQVSKVQYRGKQQRSSGCGFWRPGGWGAGCVWSLVRPRDVCLVLRGCWLAFTGCLALRGRMMKCQVLETEPGRAKDGKKEGQWAVGSGKEVRPRLVVCHCWLGLSARRRR